MGIFEATIVIFLEKLYYLSNNLNDFTHISVISFLEYVAVFYYIVVYLES